MPSSQSLSTTILVSVSMNLTILGTSFNWNYRILVFFCDWLLSLSIMSSVYPFVVCVRIPFLKVK